MKQCNKCGEEKPLDEFPFRKSAKDGRRNECRVCSRVYHKAFSDKNRTNIRHKARERALKDRYNLTPQDVKVILEEQQGSCCICGCDISKKPYVDHNHATGEVRGLLCNKCNRGLGYFNDSVANLNNAIDYLNKYGSYGGDNDVYPAAA